MNDENVHRKLAAIFHSDVVGYSKLMADNEVDTINTISEYRDVMGKLIRQHRGRVVDTSGDNVLAEFSSVVDAMQSAVSIQKELKVRNSKLPKHRWMQFRIGINIGEVIQEGERIYGDGVNIAARLESLAQPGGICVSRVAYDQIESKLPFGYEYIGERPLKNISKPLHAYRVILEDEDVSETKTEKEKKDSETKDNDSHHEFRGEGFEESFIKVKDHIKDFAREIKEDEHIGETFNEVKGKFRHFADEISGDAEKRQQVLQNLTKNRHARFIFGVVLFLFVINALTSFGRWWFLYPVVSIGLVVYLHWMKVSFFSPEKKEALRKKLIHKELSRMDSDIRGSKHGMKRAEKKASDRIQFYNHLFIYVGVNIFLVLMNLLSNPFDWWFPFPLIVWGFGLFMHWMKISARLPEQKG
jgi:class 3 adenylate cyclase